MINLTGIVIARNEEKRIADCIDSLAFCDEIILVDNGSSDNTVEIAKRMGVKIELCDKHEFFLIRNIGLAKAKGIWVLYIDADERVSNDLAENIKKIILEKYEDDTPLAYRLKRKNFYFGNHEWPHIEKLERFFYRKTLKGWRGALHESPVFEGQAGELDGFILHYTHRNLTEMVEKTIEWSEIEAKLRLQANHPPVTWWRFPRVMLTAFFDSYIKQKGYKAGTVGIVEGMYQSFSMFITYAKLWEMQSKVKSSAFAQAPADRQNAKVKTTR